MTDKILTAEMTQPDVEAAIARDAVVVVPMGSLENQGPQGFMGDYLMAGRLAVLAAERARESGVETIVLPTLPFGCWDAFAGAPGCITLAPQTFRLVLQDILQPLVKHGARRIVIVNGHGGNVEPIHEVTNAIFEQAGIVIPSVYLWKVAGTYLVEAIGLDAARKSGGHGANPLASVGMHLFPDHVRRDRAQPPQPRPDVMALPPSGIATVKFMGIDVDIPVSVRGTTVNGVTSGDMRMCSPETGAIITEKLVEMLAALCGHVAQQ